MSKELIKAYKLLLDNIFSRCKEILGEKFILKLIRKAEKNTSNGEKSLLKGLDYSQNELQLDLAYKIYNENEAAYTEEIISNTFNTLMNLTDKALTMLVGKENSLKLIKDGVQDTKLNHKEIFESEKMEELLPKNLL